MRMRWLHVGAPALLFLAGCLVLVPRFPQEVEADFARSSMRKLQTSHVDLYYPAQRRDKALRLASALERCSGILRGKLVAGPEQPKLLAYLTNANFNNAYVRPLVLGQEQQMVLTDAVSFELFNSFNLGNTRVGDISCHEAVHYVHLNDVHGFWKGVNLVTGGIWTPQQFSQGWFIEGLATYYEGQLVPHAGRPSSPLWRAMFESGIASQQGDLDASFLSPEDRRVLPFGAHYLVGMQLVQYLVDQYGEDRLWELIDTQGSSIFSPLGVTLRFDTVYGKTIGGVVDEFETHLKKTVVPRFRPAEQRTLDANAGYAARLAGSPSDGAIAIFTADRDEVTRLVVRERSGAVRFSRAMAQIFPGRSWIVTSPSAVSGLSFTADGASIFFVVDDLDAEGAFEGRLVQLDARTGDTVKIWEHLAGLGGGVSPDGTSYAFVDLASGSANLMMLRLATNAREPLTAFTGDASLGSPVISPDGRRIAYARWTAEGFNLFLREADGATRELTADGKSNYGPRWLDANTLLFTKEADGLLQVHRMDLQTGRVERVTQAPYAAVDPAPLGEGQLAFLNRDGWSWTVDAAPLQAVSAKTSAPTSGEILSLRLAPAVVESGTPIATMPSPADAGAIATAPAGSADAGAIATAPAPGGPAGSADAGAIATAPAPSGPAARTTPFGTADAGALANTPAPGLPSTGASAASGPSDSGTSIAATFASDAGASPEASVLAGSEAADAGAALADRFEPPAPPAPRLEHDGDYSAFEGFFIPRLRIPFVAFAPALDTSTNTLTPGVFATLSLSGTDRLGFHSWAATGMISTANGDNTQALAYGNYTLAPWYLLFTLSRSRVEAVTDLAATISAERTVWTTPVRLGLLALQRRVPQQEGEETAPPPVRLIGPTASVSYLASDATPYGGPRHGLGLSFDGAVYPRGVGSSFDLGDVALGVETFVPLPFSQRHSLSLTLRGHGVFGGPEPLLRVGGTGGFLVAFPSRRGAPGPSLALPPQLQFFEPLRGYEDHALPATAAAIGGAAYTYPFIIDHGWSSFLWLFPPVYLRQVDLQLFGQGAAVYLDGSEATWHGSAGAALFLRTTWQDVAPVSLYYQFAARFGDGLPPLHVFGLALE